jgi:chromosome segregation ATPase
MVIIMTLTVVLALFMILGGLAFVEVRSLQYKLQEKQRQYDDAITAIDVYRARVELHNKRIAFYRNSNEIAQDLVGNMSATETLHREHIQRLKTDIAEYKAHIKVCDQHIANQTAELKTLRVRVYALDKELRSIKDTLPDWAGGTVIDDEDDDLAPDDSHRS